MEKIKLKSGSEIQVSEISQPSENQLRFTASGVTDYASFRSKLTKAGLSEIKLYVGENLAADYGAYPKVKFPIGIEEQEDGTLNAIVILEKEDDTESRLSALEDAVDTLILTELGVL